MHTYTHTHIHTYMDFPQSLVGKESVCNAGDLGLIPGSGRFHWRKKWQPTPVFLPGESHDRGAQQAIVHGITGVIHDLVTKSPPPYTHTHTHINILQKPQCKTLSPTTKFGAKHPNQVIAGSKATWQKLPPTSEMGCKRIFMWIIPELCL